MTPEQRWQHMWELQQLPRTPGTAGGMYLKSPMTPRSRAFGDLEGGGGAGFQHEYKPHPSWVAHAHGQQAGAGAHVANSWYGGAPQQGFVQVQQVSPVAEQDESQYGFASKGKGSVGFAH